MLRRLHEKGAEAVLLDTLNFPDQVTFSLRNSDILYQGEPLGRLDGCYIRTVFYSLPPYDLEEKRSQNGKLETDNWYRDFQAERERQSLLASVFRLLDDQNIRIVNPIASFDLHYLKPLQLEILRREGIPVPETLVTNNPEELKEFKKKVKRAIYKPVAGGAQCRELTDQDMVPEKLERLRNAPVLFQELVPGENIRVYALQDRLLVSAVIESEELDYRENETGIRETSLPEEIQGMCLRAMRLCGLNFTGMDLRRKPSGEYVLLECNPSAMFMGIEEALGVDIGGRVADFLMGGR